MKTIPTWGQRSKFQYEGSVATGTKIHGRNAPVISITKEYYADILKHFACKTVKSGTPFDLPPEGSLGWYMMEQKMTRSSYVTYVGAILVEEGYAKKIGSQIKFFKYV